MTKTVPVDQAMVDEIADDDFYGADTTSRTGDTPYASADI